MRTLAAETFGEVRQGRMTPQVAVRLAVGGLLLVAAALKAHQLATEPVANRDLFTNRWALMAVVEFEFVLGIALLSGLWPRLVSFAAIACFALFSGLTLYKALSGEASCGCFGKVEVNPWYTLVLDVSAVIALAVFRPSPHRVRPEGNLQYRLVATALTALTVGIPAGIAMASYEPTVVSAEGNLIGNGKIVILEPEKWVGKPFPLLKHIDIGDQLAAGEWLVVLYDRDCSHCREAIPRYKQWARELSEQPGAARVAFIEIPPYRPRDLLRPDASYTLGRLSDKREWFATTPVVVATVDGQTLLAVEGTTSLNRLDVLDRLVMQSPEYVAMFAGTGLD